MNALFVIDTLETGGAEKSLLQIMSNFSIINPIVCSIYQGNELEASYKRNGIKVIGLGLPGKYNFINAVAALKKVIEEEKPLIIVATLLRSELIARVVGRITGVPVIGTFVNDTYSKYERENSNFIMNAKRKFFYLLDKWSSHYVIHYIANAQSIKESNAIALGIDLNKITVVYRGRDVDQFKFKQRMPNELGKIRFVNVGRLLPRKGQMELISAFYEFIKTYPNATLSFAGEGVYRDELQTRIDDLNLGNSVKLLGNVENVSVFLNDFDCFIFPSWYEGFSGALVEAMLSGIPILASNIPMNLEAVEHKKTGYIFNVKSRDSIRLALEWYIKNTVEAINMAQLAAQVARVKYDIKKISQQYEDLLIYLSTNN